MRYVYALGIVVAFLLGGYLGRRLASGPEIRTVVGPETVREVVRTVSVTKPGKEIVVTRTEERLIHKGSSTKVESKAVHRPDYRIGVQVRPSQAELSEVKVTAGRRLVGNVWGEATYDVKRKEVTLGLSYEF